MPSKSIYPTRESVEGSYEISMWLGYRASLGCPRLGLCQKSPEKTLKCTVCKKQLDGKQVFKVARLTGDTKAFLEYKDWCAECYKALTRDLEKFLHENQRRQGLME